jgi:lipoprotein NlpI
LNDVIEKAKDPDEKKSGEQLCEAHFYGGEWEIQRGAKDAAIRLLRLASEKFQPISWSLGQHAPS